VGLDELALWMQPTLSVSLSSVGIIAERHLLHAIAHMAWVPGGNLQ